MGSLRVQPRKKIHQLGLWTLMVLLACELQGPFKRGSCGVRGSLGQIALTQKDLDHHPVWLAAKCDLQLFTRSNKVTGIKQRPPQTESSQFVLRVLPNQFTLPSK